MYNVEKSLKMWNNVYEMRRNTMKLNNSGPAIFMYVVIGMMLVISLIYFVLHYSTIYKNLTVLWIGIVAFTIMYHLWVRIIMGNVTNMIKSKIKYTGWWFKEKKFEKSLIFLRFLQFYPQNMFGKK